MDAMRVEEVLSDFVNIKRRGANFMANCPFHDEKTPSFVVSPAKGIYKCFGCGKSGNSITFLMEHENLSYIDSIRFLAKRYNIEIEETESSQEEIQKVQKRDALFIVNDFAANYFQNSLLNSPEGKSIALPYFKERGFDEKTIAEFKLGYCLDVKNDFSSHALEKKYKEEFLIELGLSKKNEDGSLRDFFRGRIMFPIHNLTGKIVGFGGRVMGKADNTAKYINSPENEIYHKSQILYGMHIAKKAIPKDNYCLLVEGYTDVISLYQGGIENAVASSGTALTVEQLKIIRRFTENLYILYDGDKAGINAALRGTDLALEAGLNVKLILLPGDHDPDSYIKTFGGAQLKAYIDENSRDIVTFKANLFQSDAVKDPIKKAELTKDIIQTISLVSDNIKRSFYIKECAILMEIDEDILSREIQRIINQKRKKQQYSPSESEEVKDTQASIDLTEEIKRIDEYTSSLIIVEKELCKILLEHGNKPIESNQDDENPFFDDVTVVQYVFDRYLSNYEFESQICKKVFEVVKSNYERGDVFPISYYISHIDPEISKFAIEYCGQDNELIFDWNRKNKTLKVKKYGENYHLEVDQILAQVKIAYLEKLSKEIKEITKKAIGSDKTLSENSIMHIQIQQEFLNSFRDMREEIQYIFRKNIG